MERETFNVSSVYVLQVGIEEQHKLKFWKCLESLIQ